MLLRALCFLLLASPSRAADDFATLAQLVNEQARQMRAEVTLGAPPAPQSLPPLIEQSNRSIATIIVHGSIEKFSLLAKVLGRHFRVPGGSGLGTGWVVRTDTRGVWIVTNAHVVGARKPGESVFVQFADHVDHEVKVLGKNEKKDLALLLLPDPAKAALYPALPLADGALVGQSIVALGSPRGLRHTATFGIVSAQRITPELYPGPYIQTDAAINPGNSGGPSVDMRGRVIGVNFAKHGAQGSEGLGFIIPVSNVKQAVFQYDRDKRLSNASLGVLLADADWFPEDKSAPDLGKKAKKAASAAKGCVLGGVAPGGAADKAGLKAGDKIVSIDGVVLPEPAYDAVGALRAAVAGKSFGETLEIVAERDGKTLTIMAKLQEGK